MTAASSDRPLQGSELEGPSRDFASYCEAEFERRRNADEPFDEAAYREAMEMTLRRLRALEEEGYA
ncbi:MAG TPA: nodulation protein E [Sedimenticola thiotaurini]|uniref:Nodulation protein E n=1 Tax=Sedimenticola thiotaurini TaxID=1543721 RepID=A0A831RMU8_9GAMM|nr:nodulation protein E [Sedimenticola thiotaurini]